MQRLSLLAAASSAALLAGRASGQSSCVDDTSYADPEGYTCSYWAPSAHVCSESEYSDDDQQALLAACPVSCETCVSADGSTCGQLFDGATGYCDGNVIPGMDGSYDLNWQECHDLCATTEGCEVFLFWPDYQTGNDCHPKTACTELQGSYPSIAYSKVCDGGGA